MDEKISKLFLPILDKLYNTEPAGEPFRKPVDVVKYGCYDYYLYVKHPIDLSTIRQKLTNHEYKDAWRFVADIQLMFDNAYLFNKKGTPVYEFTNKLNKIWNSELSPIMQRLNYCCGTLHKFGPQLLFCHGTTPDRYCQIPIGAKYKCYQDQYSFCMPCFNKIETDHINIQNLTCETARMKLPTQPVKKSDFIDCANDNWQYESFIQCSQCTRRVHQICELYPAREDEVEECVQHGQLEFEQKMLCQVPEEYRFDTEGDVTVAKQNSSGQTTSIYDESQTEPIKTENKEKSNQTSNQEIIASSTSLDDELLEFARRVDDSHSAPTSPNPDEIKARYDSAKEISQKSLTTNYNNNNSNNNNKSRSDSSCRNSHLNSTTNLNINNNTTTNNNSNNSLTSNAKNSVDSIAARLSINKLSAEAHVDDTQKHTDVANISSRDKFVCNHCYRKRKIGFNLRHRKYSSRRLPHTRMSRYIETKVNEHIRENSPTAGEVTIRVLTAYRDTITVKQEMKEYVKRCKQKGQSQHPNLEEYPDEFNYTNRAIFAWQEIDGVDVCVFGMHVQEYGEDCPEPNRQVIYLSYLDSVHFFRPKQVRTAVYHEILLSYFKYVKKLGFRRVFIWVCPSRKGDDYIFYRHPTEQKMPTLKRLSDWYVNLLDKGIMAGIVEKHQNIFQYANTQNWTSLLSMPYLSGDYWPGEFERLLNIMIESQKEYDAKLLQLEKKEADSTKPLDISELADCSSRPVTNCYMNIDRTNERHNMLSLTSIYQKQPPTCNNKTFNLKASLMLSGLGLKPVNSNGHLNCYTSDGDCNNISSLNDELKYFGAFTPDSSRSDPDQPLDLSKSSSTTSPESYFDDDMMSELSFKTATSNRKKRRKSNSMGYTKKRSRTAATQNPNSFVTRGCRQNQVSNICDSSQKYRSQQVKACRKASTQSQKDSSEIPVKPEEELMKNLERSLKRQREGFIVARLNECDCSPHFESQRRKEETTFTCELMKGREPFLQLARLKNYEFSTLRRAKFSSLAMVKHLGQYFKLDPICNECYSFDSSKRHYACSHCEDYYLCTSCHENTHHEHIMSAMAPLTLPDIDEFLQQCSMASTTNSISSASSTISNKSFNESNLEVSSIHSVTPTLRKGAPTSNNTPLNRQLSNATMPLSCHRQKNHDFGITDCRTRTEDEENADICNFNATTKLSLPNLPSPPPSHSASNIRSSSTTFDIDHVLVDNFMRHAEVSYDVDFDEMKTESKKLLSHYWACPLKDTCHKCKFVVLSCSFMNALMRSTRMQMLMNCNPSEILPNSNINTNHHSSGINLTTAHRFNYQQKDK